MKMLLFYLGIFSLVLINPYPQKKNMNIVILDGYALNPGDLSWAALESLGTLTVYDRTAPEQVVERASNAVIILTNKVAINAEQLQQLPNLKHIGVLATGYNIIDTEAAKNQGVSVSNIPNYSTPSVVQLTFALLLELCQHVQRHSDAAKEGKWARSLDFSFRDYPLIELSEKTLGIIGFGSIGQAVADVATAFGMNIIGSSRRQPDQSHRKNFKWASIPELLRTSDVVSIHCPLTPETNRLINRESLATMKDSAFLINTARGPIIVEEDLANALNQGIIAGAGIDVLSVEPPALDNPLFKAKNCLITPHIAWASFEARSRLMKIAEKNIRSFTAGHSVNIVNP